MKFILILVLAIAQYVNIASARNLPDPGIDTSDAIEENVYAEVTYPGIGTFTTKDFFDIVIRPIVLLPQSPEHINTRFLLHTRKNLKEHQILKVHDHDSIKNSLFNGKNPTKFIIHGFIDNQLFGDWMRTMKDEFLIAGDYNIIIVDWSGGNGLPYGQATANTRVVGPVVAMLIEDLKNVTGADLSTFHILGHSLGSHVAGYAGKKLNKVGRITGLDPAGPYYEGLPPAGRLDKGDAVFVDAIHTDAKHLIPDLGFGMYETSAHVDFYPNGGRDQPGCDQERFTKIFTDGLAEGARRLVACDHQRAIDFYTAAINHNKMVGVGYQCDDFASFTEGKCTDCGTNGEKCAILGPDVESWKKFKDTNSGQRFFLRTGEHYPYFKFEFEITVKFSEPGSHLDQHGVLMLTLHSPHASEKVNLNQKDEIFHLGKSYSFLVTTDYNMGDIDKVTFSWHRPGFLLFKGQLYVDSIKVVPLSSPNIMDRAKHETEIKTFCAKNRGQPVDNENEEEFAVICK
jgi:pancreatic triacylglycerol lipase